MAISFFRALNPTSKRSGTYYSYSLRAWTPEIGNPEIHDRTVSENIRSAWKKDLDFLSGITTTFEVIVGTHYPLANDKADGGAKGALDYLIFPLLARKLICDIFSCHKRNDTVGSVINLCSWAISLPLEIARFSIGAILTLCLIPIIAMAHLIKAHLPQQEEPEPAVHFSPSVA